MQNFLELSDVSLKKYNTLRLDAYAKRLYFPLNQEGLVEVLRMTKGKQRYLLGKGSNVLLTKEVYPEDVVFIVTTHMDEIRIDGEELVLEAGVSLSQLTWFAIEHAIDGYAFAEDIPGTIGGALIMNAGQFEFTIGQYVHWVDVYDDVLNEVKRILPDNDFFSYRNSGFKASETILACGLRNVGGEELENIEKVISYKKERYRKQPRNYPNAGSVFKRPQKDGKTLFVWKLFEECGLRGKRIGDAEISFKHPGFIVNLGKATQSDVLALIDCCKEEVKKHFDVDLELEWRVLD